MYCIAFFMIIVLIGALTSLPAWLPSLRRLARSNLSLRVLVILICGLLPWFLAFAGILRVGATFEVIGYTLSGPSAEVEFVQANSAAVTHELWLRKLVPPSFPSACYTTQAQICALAGSVPNFSRGSWFMYLGTIVLAGLAGVVGAMSAAIASRRQEKGKRRG